MSIKNWSIAIILGALFGTSANAQNQPGYTWKAGQNQRISFPRKMDHVIQDPGQTEGTIQAVPRSKQDNPSLIDRQGSVSDVKSPTDSLLSKPQSSSHNPIQPRNPIEPSLIESEGRKVADKSSLNSFSLPPAPPINSTISNQPGLSVPDSGEPRPACEKEPSWCNLGCERKIFGTTRRGTAIGGWTQLGAHSFNTLGFNNRQDELNLHQQWLYLDRPAGANSNWGYRADLVYGIDAQDTQAFGNPVTGAPTGWDNSWDFGSYGWAIPQTYVSYKNCCWDVKMGRFFAPFGFENIMSPQNFFYSRSYAFNFIEPFTMTGVLGERRLSDQRTIIAGATTGWNTAFAQNGGGLNAIVGMRQQLRDNVRLSSTASFGDTGYRGSGYMNSQVLEVGFLKRGRFVMQGDMLNLGTNQEFSIINYLFYDFNPCLKVGSRLEWWKSDQIFPDTRSTYSWTRGINYRPNANVTIRPEARVDWGAGAIDPGRTIFAVDAIVTF